MALTDKGHLQI